MNSGQQISYSHRAMRIDKKFKKISREFTDAMGPVALMLDTINSGQQISYNLSKSVPSPGIHL